MGTTVPTAAGVVAQTRVVVVAGAVIVVLALVVVVAEGQIRCWTVVVVIGKAIAIRRGRRRGRREDGFASRRLGPRQRQCLCLQGNGWIEGFVSAIWCPSRLKEN